MFHSQKEQIYLHLLSICLQAYENIQSRHGYKSSKTFFVSQAYGFFQELIHLHSKEINQFIRKLLKDCLGNMEIEVQNLSFQEIMKDQREVSSWKNHHYPQELWEKLQRLIRFHLESECRDKNPLQLQNIELQVQCSLNYSCPKCMIREDKDEPRSMRLIECQHDFDEDVNAKRQPVTLKLIEEEKIAPSKENRKLQNIFDHMRKERQKHIEIRRQQNRQMNKWWKNIGNLMALQKEHLESSNHRVSLQARKEELFKEIYLRNVTNELMINKFSQKFNKKSQRKLTRSLSIKNHIEDLETADQNQDRESKIYSVKVIKKEVKRPNKKRVTPERNRGFQVSPAKKFDIGLGSCLPVPVQKTKVGLTDFHDHNMTERAFRFKAINPSILLHH